MILYNMRHRGPLEYDKYVLNILGLHNEVNYTYFDIVGQQSILVQSHKEVKNNLTNTLNISNEVFRQIYMEGRI